jgi:hypothetical protein
VNFFLAARLGFPTFPTAVNEGGKEKRRNKEMSRPFFYKLKFTPIIDRNIYWKPFVMLVMVVPLPCE